MMRRYLSLSLVFLSGFFALSSSASAEETNPMDLNKVVCDQAAHYSREMISESREGWVELRFTMKPDGRFTDIEVVSFFGENYFAEAAQKAMESCRYTRPDLISPQGTEVRNLRTPYFFKLVDGKSERTDKGSSEEVYKKIRVSKNLLNIGNIEESEKILNEAEAVSRKLYEYIHIIIQRAVLETARGHKNLSLIYLRGISKHKQYIQEKEFRQLLRMRLAIELMEGHYVQAEKTASEMAEKPMDGDEKLLAQVALLKGVMTAGAPVSVAGELPANCHPAFCDLKEPEWSYLPYNRTVSLANIQGKLTNIFFRCENKTAKFKADPDITWTIPESWGSCSIDVKGEPGTKFELIDEYI
ncbi:energy transducer TonB [Niveispirillum irakense]|uniref:energy transducer TonB n=1 Tax=Niveispirillum irakense TaxID=34011 RepID=UPI000A01A02C|nr:energy transducer TonB [Niveispirillum irakense]